MTRKQNGAKTPASSQTADIPTMHVVDTKLYIPRWSTALVARPTLTSRITDGISGKLTVVSAPAGSGKTTLLAEWLAGDQRAGWVSLDAGENDPVAFWVCVIRALQNVHPDVGGNALAMLQADGTPTVAALTSLINEIGSIDADFVLVLDDYHVIDAPAVHTGLAFLLDHVPPRMHVIIATRSDPVLPLARMRARGEVTELRAADLRFTPDEASVFFNRVMTLALPASDIATLAQRAEGWIAGLKLAALSMRGKDDVRKFVDAFAGDNRYIADYLIEEVLQRQPPHVRRFLLATAVLERLSARLCDAVTGEKGSQALLETLELSNLFVVALDDRREWYRYHHLFADVLQTLALREDPDEVRERHRRASTWYERNGAVENAVRHAIEADDEERVAELLERAWPAMDRSYQSGRWLARVRALSPAVVKARPVLHMGYAWGLLNAGELEVAERELDEVAKSIASPAAAIISDAKRFAALPREHAMASVYLAQSRGDAQSTVAHATRALELVPEGDHASRATAAALLALAHWAAGDLQRAFDTFNDALAGMRRAGEMLSAIRGVFVLGDIRTIQGRLREAESIYESGLQLAAEHAQAGVAETDELYLGLSELHYERGDLTEATRVLKMIAQTAPGTSHKGNKHRWCTVMARIAVASADFERALQLLAEAKAHHRRDPLPQVRPIAASTARVHIAAGNIADAIRWARDARVDDRDEVVYIREFDHMTLARLFIARHTAEPDKRWITKAIALLDRLATAGMEGGRLGSVIEATVLRALAQHAQSDTRAALDDLAAALELAEPERYLRVFVDEGTRMRDLLRQAAARGMAASYTRRILTAFDGTSTPVPAADAPVATGSSVQVLTPRELEILRLIAVGMRNKEIADQLFISTATVKRHIANVYDKLDARHRTEALRRAGELSLL